MAETAGTTASTATSYSTDPALYIYTSLTAGSSHIVTATSRLETILRANRVPFKALDIATDEKARMLWGRRAGKDDGGRMRKLPGLVQMGMVLGDLVEIEEWNEYGELKQHVTIYYDDFTIPPKSQAPPPVAMRPLNQPFPKSGIAPSSSHTAATTTPVTSKGVPAPPAPPLPTDKDKAKIALSSPNSTGTAKKVANAAATATAPIHNLAEEAAQKAKKVQLDRLREKVHGKKDTPSSSTAEGKDKENKIPDAADPKHTKKATSAAADSVSASISNLTLASDGPASAVGIQSPTTGKWRSGASSDGGAQPLLQSPTTGTWKAGANRGIGETITQHRGSVVASASEEEIAAIEKAEAIPEVDSSEEEDEEEEDESEDESEDEEDEEDEEEDEDDDEDEDDEEDDDDDDDDEDDEDEDEDEDEESEDDNKKTAKVKN
ncbi:hypothetical protein FHL15_005305 [Xylaria flabelliformis]|uniref:Uncharacterized protein n=1 Tax=Xylaria flabelliformis TaxID=2512241 RepID=A0A553I130_9PEZI|nr:hypothetical protein FHL15_005305 [Xylaria flabelliformis]